ncbi:hypothetical protein [Ensifer sp. MJa1]|uniref:hypothetical protein n=1 Tax=Ensifer sp. MJa1 TaxID=2919888 RepID=UPI003009592B
MSRKYFHVVVRTKDDKKKPVFLFGDLSEGELRTKFLKPYRRGGKLFVENAIIDVADLASIKIIETAQPKDDVLEEMQETSRKAIDKMNRESGTFVIMSIGVGYRDTDIEHDGDDVTSQFITDGPGTASQLFQIMNNNWTMTIGGGVLVALFSWLLL